MKNKVLLLLVLALAACCVGGPPASDAGSAGDVELVGHIGGAANAVFVRGEYIYAGFGAEMAILDVANPVSPERVGYVVLQGVVEDIAVSGDHAYVLVGSSYAHVDDGRLWVVDISDPTDPFDVQEIPISGTTVKIGMSDPVGHTYAYVGGQEGLIVLDVSTPTVPVEVGAYRAPQRAEGLTVTGGYAYVVWCAPDPEGECNGGSLDVVDLSRPRSPKRAGRIEVSDPLSGPVEVVEDYLYVAGRDSGLHLVDVSRPAHPVCVGDLGHVKRPTSIVARGDRVYVADARGTLWVLNVSEAGAPVRVRSHSVLRAESADIAVAASDLQDHGDPRMRIYAYIANGDAGGMQVVDVSDPAAVFGVGGYGAPGRAAHVAAADGYIYVASQEGAFWIVGVSDPARPAQVGSHLTRFGRASHSLAVADSHVYVSAGNDVRVIDVSVPAVPVEIGVYTASVSVIHGMAVGGGYLYVAAEVAGPRCKPDGGFRVLDVSNPADLREVGGFDIDFGSLENVGVIVDDYAYVAGWTGLLVVDVSEPAQPIAIGSHYTPGTAHNVAILGNHAYVADDFFGLRVFDVSAPTTPVDAGQYGFAAVTRDVAVGEGHVYVTNDLEGLWVLDVSDPTALARPRNFYVPGRPRVAAAGEWVYVLESMSGLYVLRVP